MSANSLTLSDKTLLLESMDHLISEFLDSIDDTHATKDQSRALLQLRFTRSKIVNESSIFNGVELSNIFCAIESYRRASLPKKQWQLQMIRNVFLQFSTSRRLPSELTYPPNEQTELDILVDASRFPSQ